MSDAAAGEAPGLAYETTPEGARTVRLRGVWSLQALRPRLRELRRELNAFGADETVRWDLCAVAQLDHAGAALLWRAWGRRRSPQLALRGEHEAFFRRLARAA